MRRFLLIASAATLAACTANMDLRYQPQRAATYVPGSEKIAVFVAPVDDVSGGFKSDFQAGKVQYARPMTEGVREALAAELKRDGFTVVEAENEANAVVRGALTSAHTWMTDLGTFHFVTHTAVLIDISLEERATRRRVWSGSVEGEVRSAPGVGTGPGDWNGFANGALAEAMAKLGPLLARADLTKIGAGPEQVAQASPAPPPHGPAAGSDVDIPEPNVPATHPHFYAVIIGVGRYRKNLPAAEFADADARMFSRYVAGYGVPAQNIVTLINDEAGKSDFEKYFEKWLPNHVEADDVVLVYYSGHGAPNPKNGDAYLVPYDGDPLYLEETAYPLKKLYAELAKLRSKDVTVVLDSCFSGAGGRSVIAAGARPLVNVRPAEVPGKITVISAAAADQTSNAYREQGHGLFTYYFLKGLQKYHGDIRGVYDYLKPQVSAYARRELNTDQEPQWRGK